MMNNAKNFRVYNRNVFINCPFDNRKYQKLLNAVIFVVLDCGFRPCCAKEKQDGGEERITKIQNIIQKCQFGIHDISLTELDHKTNLPRFNMPLELGLFLGAKRYSKIKAQRAKQTLILDKEQHNYDKSISDLSGKDIEIHSMKIKSIIIIIRDWLTHFSEKVTYGGDEIYKKYRVFKKEIGPLCRKERLNPNKLSYNDYFLIVESWLKSEGDK